MKSYLKEIVNFNQNAKPLIDSMGEYDKQLEQNKEIEQQLAQWQKRFDESGKNEISFSQLTWIVFLIVCYFLLQLFLKLAKHPKSFFTVFYAIKNPTVKIFKTENLVYSTENDLHKEQEKSNVLTAEIEAAEAELKNLKSQQIANEKIKDPILSLFNI